ncbi:Ig-like domain-containing protein [Bordetella genomosp. 4]|uniref:BIG2 domain-containing protein n=1 Tax=Bordetella genomosp. 4 TaxID=463044 RepID=A0A261U8T8_9BORD|nr:Ig-like domain-containing protein [Bordetella genomosp. 4]OZI57670.1 hypothetical protein CAL20_09860 [Bordetella genomosp. 4]
MAVCKNKKYVGRDVVLEYVIGCGDTLPTPSEWKRLGSMRTKDFSAEWDAADGTADDSIGNLRENLSTFLAFSVSGDGTLVNTGPSGENLKELTKHFFNPVATGGQPNIWTRLTYPDLTFIAYTRMASFGRSAPYDDVATYSIELEATSSDAGLIVEDTPNPDAPAVTSVEVVPSTLSLEIGDTYDIEAVVLPTSATQAVSWASSDVAVATVIASSGVVTGVSAGTATITATSTADSTKTDTCAVTVTAA